MDTFDFWWLLLPIVLLPVFFAMGWFAARVDMKVVVRNAKAVPEGFYSSLDALVDENTNRAARHLAEITEGGQGVEYYDLQLTLGKLYRQRGENDKAIAVHRTLLGSPDIVGDKNERVQYELGLDYKSAGLVDRAEQIFLKLKEGNMAKQANEVLLSIYQQDRDWQKAIDTANLLAHDEQTYQFEIAQFHCELAQAALFQSDLQNARTHIAAALDANKKCCRANMILGDIEMKEGEFQAAAAAYAAIEKQNHAYLGMVGERLYDAFDAQGKAAEGLDILIGYAKTFPQLDLLNVIYEKSLLLYGEEKAAQITVELVRLQPDLSGIHRLLGMQLSELNPQWKADADMMRNVIGRQMQKNVLYRCRSCHFKSQAFFWHCPACNKWETFTPNKIEV